MKRFGSCAPLVSCGSLLFVVTTWAASTPIDSAAPRSPLFSAGTAERFRIVDAKGEAPRFRLLEGSARKRAMAFAINAALRASANGDKAAASSNYVDARIEELLIRPDRSNSNKLRLVLRVSGQGFDIDETIDRKAFVEGRKIALQIRRQTEEAPPITVETSGHLSLRWDEAQNSIEIARGQADFTLSAPLTDDTTESIDFSGRGLRE